MNGSRREFLVAAGSIAAGVGGYSGAAAGTPTNRITVGELPALADVTTAFDREHPDVELETADAEGFEEFVHGERDVQQAARPMTATERKRALDNGVEPAVRELPLQGVAALGPSDGWCRCLRDGGREEFTGTGVETWSEVTSTVPDDAGSADLPEAGTDVLVRGTRPHQYAKGHGGTGDYRASPAAFESIDAADGLTPAVKLAFAYVDRATLEREPVASFVRSHEAATSDVEHVPVSELSIDG